MAGLEGLGIRCVLAVTCSDDDGPFDPESAILQAEEHLARTKASGLIHSSVAVPIAESVGAETMAALARWCSEASVPLQMHVNEHLAAVERMLVTHGRRPLQYLDDLGAVGPWLLAAHSTLLTPAEVLLLRDRGAAVSYNPVATYWKGNATAPALWMDELGVRLGLGTDGTRSDGFRLMDAAETAQRLHSAIETGDPLAGGGHAWLRAGTRGGAEAVGLGEVIGRVAPGFAADYLLVDLDVPEFVSTRDLIWELVRRGARDQIRQVVVAGRLRLVDGWPPDFDKEAFLARTRRHADSAATRARLRRDR